MSDYVQSAQISLINTYHILEPFSYQQQCTLEISVNFNMVVIFSCNLFTQYSNNQL